MKTELKMDQVNNDQFVGKIIDIDGYVITYVIDRNNHEFKKLFNGWLLHRYYSEQAMIRNVARYDGYRLSMK